jgi:TetR/AcrR family transcriptional regulator, fatty acid metabolism regulator protein
VTAPAYSRLPRERRIADIMRAAREVFDEKGYAAASVAEIAERAGVVEGSVYRYFEHKRALLVSVVERWYEELLSDYDEHVKVITGTWDRLRYLVWKHLSTIEKEPMLVRLVFEELRPGGDYRQTDVFELNRAYTKRTLDILKAGIARGEIRDDVSLAVARDMIYGGVEHHTWAYVRGEGKFDPVAAADSIIDILRAGIGREARKDSHVQKSPRRKSR